MLIGFILTNIIIYLSSNILMKETLKKISGFSKFKTWYGQLSFWKKIIIIFTFNTCILLILADFIMLILFAKISNGIINIAYSERDQFTSVSNSQIAQCSANRFLNRMGLYSNLLTQLVNVYSFYSVNPQYYSSKESASKHIPPLTRSFSNFSYNSLGYFNYNDNSTFTDLPYLDELLLNMLSNPYLTESIKRINIFVLNNSNHYDLTARTIPATNMFTIQNPLQIENRFQNIAQGRFNISTPYEDTLTLDKNKQSLIAFRSIIKNKIQTIMLEVEIHGDTFRDALDSIYYFPKAIVLFLYQNDNGIAYFSNPPADNIASKISQFYPIGTKKIMINGVNYVSASIGLSNNYPLDTISQITNQPQDPFRSILIVQAQYIQKPSIQISQFLKNENNILIGIVLFWSLIILIATIGLSIVVGNYIFQNLKILSTKIDQYIKDPTKFHLIVIQLKQLELSGILRKLSENLIGIIEKIQVRKRERKDRINQNYHPLSLGEPKFQERQQLNDYEIINKIKQAVRQRVQAMKTQASSKQKFQYQKND